MNIHHLPFREADVFKDVATFLIAGGLNLIGEEMNKSSVFFMLVVLFCLVNYVSAQEKISIIVLEKGNVNLDMENFFSSAVGPVTVDPADVTHRYSSFDGFSAEVSLEEYESLMADKTKKVFLDKKYYISLDASAPQIEADTVWGLDVDGVKLTGAGETVCVIDTGVNYTHSSLGGCYGNNNASSLCKVIGGYDFVNDDSDPMDDHSDGHGTHVTGIISSDNSTYRGIANATKIISIKALDSTGSGTSSDIAAGIDWCVTNSTTFNISVISMSLGDCSNHTSYCNGDSLASSINAAVAKNITVVVAAGNGNSGSCTGINITLGPSSPACVQNATAIGAVTDADSILYQRGSGIFELMAPGSGIFSTVIGGGFGSKSGTSMATPHVAGAIAILQQLSRMQDSFDLTNSEVRTTLNSTGESLDDSAGSGYFYSRINVYDAVLSLDNLNPQVILISPSNAQINLSQNRTFVCNTTDWQLSNVTFSIWNSTAFYNTSLVNVSGSSNQSSFSLNNLPYSTYTWNCLGMDAKNNFASAGSNFTLTVGGISVTLNEPLRENYTKIDEINFNCSVLSDTNNAVSNLTFYLWNNSGDLNYSSTVNLSGLSNSSLFNFNFTSDGNYSWNCLGENNQSDSSFANSNYSIIYDVTAPNISSLSVGSITTSSAVITWTTSEATNSSVSGEVSGSNSSYSTSHSFSFSSLSASTTYDYNITSCDRAGNCNSSTGNSFTTDSNSVSNSGGGGSSGGGGGGTVTTTPIPTSTEKIIDLNLVGDELTESVGLEEFIKFDVDGNRHSLRVLEISLNFVRALIQSEPVYVNFTVGEEKKFNFTSNETYDTMVKLNSINFGKANFTLARISEEIPRGTFDDRIFNTMENRGIQSIINLFNSPIKKLISTILLVIVLFIGVIVLTKKLKRKELTKVYVEKTKAATS